MRLLTNARFHSMVSPGDTFAALLESAGRIRALYRRAEDIPAGLDAEVLDLAGAEVYPGFVDTHTHAFEGGLYALCCDLGHCSSVPEVLDALAAAEPVGGLILGWNLDVHRLQERRFPTMEELDRIRPDLPMIIRRIDGHSCMINRAALKRIPWREEPPTEFPLVRGLSRQATGWFHETVNEEGILAAYESASEQALKAGLTGLHAMIGDGERDPRHYPLIRDNLHRFAVDFTLYPQIRDVAVALELGSPRVGGCLLADGSIGSHTAALKAPYADRPETSGELYRDDAHWYDFFRSAHRAGLQACVHAIGDAAVGQIAAVLQRVYREDPKPLRHEIIHCEMVDDTTLELLEGLPAAAVMQPSFDAFWGGESGLYNTHLGPERLWLCNRFASLQKAGVLITGGTDWYITPLDPLGGIRTTMNPSNSGQGLSAFDSVSLITRNAAVLVGTDDRQGMLRPGYECSLSLVSGSVEDPHSRIRGVFTAATGLHTW